MLDPIYNQDILNQIRSNCFLYIHGHSAGGTNPSLVEAMSLGLPVCAYDVTYNRETTSNSAIYFKDSIALQSLLQNLDTSALNTNAKKMLLLASDNFTWSKIATAYQNLF